MRIAVKRLDPDLPLPRYARASDAGLDLHAAARVVIAPGARAVVGTGIALAIPEGFAGLVLPRSGLALRHGVTVLNTPGLVDSGYRGEVKVLLINHDPSAAVTVERGERIAQGLFVKVETAQWVEVDGHGAETRGGFGSTGSHS